MIERSLLIIKLKVILTCILLCCVVACISIQQSEEVPAMEDFGTFSNISQYLPPAAPLRVNINQGWEYVRIINNSPFLLTVDFGGSSKLTLPEMYLEDIKIPGQGPGWIVITPKANLTNTSQAISSSISITTFTKGELTSPQAQPLTQQAVNVTSSGKPIFSATVQFGTTVSAQQTLNIFNPPTSGVTATFHAARIITNSNSAVVPVANLAYKSGADLNLAGAVAINSHAGTPNPPVSAMHATSEDAVHFIGGVPAEVMQIPQSAYEDGLTFPDNTTLTPGGNLFFQLTDASGKYVTLTLKWTEDVFVFAPVGGVNLGTIANQIINEGNPLQPVVQATKLGDTPEDVLINNDGTATFKGAVTIGGDLTLSTGRIGVVSSGDVINANGFDTFLASRGAGNILHLRNATTDVVTVDSAGAHLAGAVVFDTGTSGKVKLQAGTLTRFTGFSGTGSGTVNTNLGAVPNQIAFNPDTVSGSTQAIGGTVAQSSVVTVTNAQGWGGIAFKDV